MSPNLPSASAVERFKCFYLLLLSLVALTYHRICWFFRLSLSRPGSFPFAFLVSSTRNPKGRSLAYLAMFATMALVCCASSSEHGVAILHSIPVL